MLKFPENLSKIEQQLFEILIFLCVLYCRVRVVFSREAHIFITPARAVQEASVSIS